MAVWWKANLATKGRRLLHLLVQSRIHQSNLRFSTVSDWKQKRLPPADLIQWLTLLRWTQSLVYYGLNLVIQFRWLFINMFYSCEFSTVCFGEDIQKWIISTILNSFKFDQSSIKVSMWSHVSTILVRLSKASNNLFKFKGQPGQS